MTSVKAVEIQKVGKDSFESTPDLIVTEEPLEIRLGYGSESQRKQMTLSVTMRTPGSDEELCLGFLYGEDIINSIQDVLSVKYCDELGTKENHENVMRVELSSHVNIDPKQFSRNFYTTSSCGVCGKAAIEAIHVHCSPLLNDKINIDQNLFYELPGKLRKAQEVFKYTGGLHASAAFDLQGKLIAHREDVGRHNALDKLIGHFFKSDMPQLNSSILLLSGRISFELVQKAIRAGIPIIAAMGAPSSLAVALAKDFKVTLIGFLKESKFNIYTGKDRVLR
ncbi:MAG: formate dehydrogenase accessory sulfurtransferase FdhD [Bacteroidetes bacterium]|nr:formate dehydrogenase accessory sulfurtransferase FdhD [Bacteroidota bacterium]MDA1122227.1 formate dehydrogenase accessory sulfurtransferase FdhD [Bacteroidota bacterium]